jgi:hypothetical protein
LYSRLERLAREKHFSLLGQLVSIEENSVVNTAPVYDPPLIGKKYKKYYVVLIITYFKLLLKYCLAKLGNGNIYG